MLAKLKEMREINNLVEQNVKAKREEIKREKIRKVTSHEITEGIGKRTIIKSVKSITCNKTTISGAW